MMLILPDKSVNLRQLGQELTALNLSGFTGVARLSREVDDQGHVVLENGAVKKVPPYILVKSDALNAAQTTAATKAVADHIPIAEIKTDPRFEDQAKTIEDDTVLDPATKEALAALARAL